MRDHDATLYRSCDHPAAADHLYIEPVDADEIDALMHHRKLDLPVRRICDGSLSHPFVLRISSRSLDAMHRHLECVTSNG